MLFAVPGAFTPGCSVKHLPGYIENLPKLKAKGVDIVAVIAFNDAWVMSAWGKANGIKGDDIVRSSYLPTYPSSLHPRTRQLPHSQNFGMEQGQCIGTDADCG